MRTYTHRHTLTHADNVAWIPKYALVMEEADSYGWMDEILAKLLPENIKANKKMLNTTKAALQAADVQSKVYLVNMSMEDLKMAKVPRVARRYLCKTRH